MFCGIDWASERHTVCVLDDAGTKASAFQISHTADGFDQLVARLARLGEPATLPVAIERPDGRLVDRLLEAGHPVVAVQPNAIKAWRDAEVLSGADTTRDAAVIAETSACATTGRGPCSRSRLRLARCAPSFAPAPTWSTNR